MTILQILLSAGILGILGFIFYWFTTALKAGVDKTKEDINKDEHFQ